MRSLCMHFYFPRYCFEKCFTKYCLVLVILVIVFFQGSAAKLPVTKIRHKLVEIYHWWLQKYYHYCQWHQQQCCCCWESCCGAVVAQSPEWCSAWLWNLAVALSLSPVWCSAWLWSQECCRQHHFLLVQP